MDLKCILYKVWRKVRCGYKKKAVVCVSTAGVDRAREGEEMERAVM